MTTLGLTLNEAKTSVKDAAPSKKSVRRIKTKLADRIMSLATSASDPVEMPRGFNKAGQLRSLHVGSANCDLRASGFQPRL
jgi:hypothetical protein